jgi:hypothetical protein
MKKLYEALYAAEFDYRYVKTYRLSQGAAATAYGPDDEQFHRDRRDRAREALEKALKAAAWGEGYRRCQRDDIESIELSPNPYAEG